MNYMQARQLKDGSGWHMTVQNDDRVWTHQCCCTEVPATQEDVDRLDWIYMGRLKVGDPITGPAHEPHPTKEEAEDCYNDWRVKQIRETVEWETALFPHWNDCAACGGPTKGGARFNDGHAQYIALCPDHRTIEDILSKFERVTASAYS